MSEIRIDKAKLLIEIPQGNGFYKVDLDQLIDSASALDCILQVAGKQWCTPEILFNFVTALNKACKHFHGKNIQELFCPCGSEKKVNWGK
jgi:hypothetical protein